ncbi:MAG TPA: GH3 auxin-responsive promoter family protein [Cytophagales bacterium]|nr:GH3 auxin-responsive promoter family protein [Cytophagales bacterium]
MKKRIHQIELFMKYPQDVQNELLKKLISTAQSTEWGKKHGFSSTVNANDFRERVPLSTYEDLFPYIDRLMKGEDNLLWPGKIKWFAKSSGTTNARSKFIPVSKESLEDCHYKGGKDMLSLFINNKPDTKVFTGKGLSIGGSHQVNPLNPDSFYGDVSAVIMQNLPFWAQFIRTPTLEIALMDDWEQKIERMAEYTMNENVTSLLGVPTWTILLLQRILEKTGKSSIAEVWPNLEVFLHGAVAFGPYRGLFDNIISNPSMNYMEIYNASEGFFGIEDVLGTKDMLLMLDYGIFYEFIPLDEIDKDQPKTLLLEEVELDKNYAIVISTNAGLWRYVIGDTVKFTSKYPYRIRITGRTKHFINAFGEELIIENAESALAKAIQVTGAEISNFTAAPVYLESNSKGGHEWLIEFHKEPDNLDTFINTLDKTLREVNSDYDAKRAGDKAMIKPLVRVMPQGTFYNWLKSKGKLGGQYKVPRLSNNREILEEILHSI